MALNDNFLQLSMDDDEGSSLIELESQEDIKQKGQASSHSELSAFTQSLNQA